MCSDMRAFPPSPAALLGAMTGPEVKSHSNSNSHRHRKSTSDGNKRSGKNSRRLSRCALLPLL